MKLTCRCQLLQTGMKYVYSLVGLLVSLPKFINLVFCVLFRGKVCGESIMCFFKVFLTPLSGSVSKMSTVCSPTKCSNNARLRSGSVTANATIMLLNLLNHFFHLTATPPGSPVESNSGKIGNAAAMLEIVQFRAKMSAARVTLFQVDLSCFDGVCVVNCCNRLFLLPL
jgi:hypothetical protein